MLFEIIETPKIVWRTSNFKSLTQGRGWSLDGLVDGQTRFRLFWDNADQMTRLEDCLGGTVCDIINGCQQAAKALAVRWLEDL